MEWEVAEILAVTEEWGSFDRSHRSSLTAAPTPPGCGSLPPAGSWLLTGWLCPSRQREILLHGSPGRHGCRGSRIASGAGPVASPPCEEGPLAIVDVVSRRWIDTLVSIEETSSQVAVIFDRALIAEGLAELITPERIELPIDDPARPILWPAATTARR